MRHLLSIEDLDRPAIERIVQRAASFAEVSDREIKKVPALRGRMVLNLFYEASTRTRTSFEVAEKRRGSYIDFRNVQGPSMDEIPQGLAGAPVHYTDLRTGEEHDLRFVAGMFGVEQNAVTRALSPAFGWAIVYDPPG